MKWVFTQTNTVFEAQRALETGLVTVAPTPTATPVAGGRGGILPFLVWGAAVASVVLTSPLDSLSKTTGLGGEVLPRLDV